MRRMTVLDHPDHVMGGEIYYREDKYMRDPELREAYECGYAKGRKEAYKEIMEEQYGERRDWREMPLMYRGEGSRGGVNYREDERGWNDDYSERRRRDSRGRYM